MPLSLYPLGSAVVVVVVVVIIVVVVPGKRLAVHVAAAVVPRIGCCARCCYCGGCPGRMVAVHVAAAVVCLGSVAAHAVVIVVVAP